MEGLGPIVAPRLRRLAVHAPLGDAEVQSIAGADLSGLESMVLGVYGHEEQLRMLAPLLEGGRTPKLRELTLNARYSPASTFLGLAAASRLLRQLETLEVVSAVGRDGYATAADPKNDDDGFDALVSRPGAFRHLRTLTLGGVTLGRERASELRQALPKLVLRPARRHGTASPSASG